MKTTTNHTTAKLVLASVTLIALGGIGLAFACKRAQLRRCKAKNLSVQIV